MMTSSMRDRIDWRGDCGQALVEFALASTLFFMTIFGVVGFGVAVWQYNMVADLAEEGARWAAVRGSSTSTPATDGTVETYVLGRAVGMTAVDLDVATTWPDGGSPANLAGKKVQVVVTKTYTPVGAFIPHGTLTFQSTAQMVIAR
jgi:Flp pilus assembly protein TadG